MWSCRLLSLPLDTKDQGSLRRAVARARPVIGSEARFTPLTLCARLPFRALETPSIPRAKIGHMYTGWSTSHPDIFVVNPSRSANTMAIASKGTPKSAVARADVEHAVYVFCVFVCHTQGMGMVRDTDRPGQYVACSSRVAFTESVTIVLMLTIERDRVQTPYDECSITSLNISIVCTTSRCFR